MKGALVSFMPAFVGSVSNVVVFQYNPETIQHSWTQAGKSARAAKPRAGVDPMAAAGVPGESFSFTLRLDAQDEIADGGFDPVAAERALDSGVYNRLASLEMLQYPSSAFSGARLVGSVSASIRIAGQRVSFSATFSLQAATVPRSEVPTVLFVWGPNRIVPVRVTNLSITEKLYDASLNATQADVSITLQVLTPEEISAIKGEMKTIAQVAYIYSQGLRQDEAAAASQGNAASSNIGMLPTSF